MNNIKILTYLLKNKNKYTINQIAKAVKINYRIAHTQIKILEKERIIRTERVGNSLLCSLTNKFNEKIFVAEYLRRNNILKKKDFKILQKRFSGAKQNYVLLLFGSYAKNKATKHSDIDLLAITENKKEIENISELIPKNIHLTTLSYNEFINMKNSKEMTVVSEAIKNNIILINIEGYYRILND